MMEYDELENELLEALGLCGCGIPEAVIAFYGDALNAIRERSAQHYADDAPQPFADQRENEAVWYALMYVLDDKGMTEHGGGVGGAWLTPRGEEVLAKITEYVRRAEVAE